MSKCPKCGSEYYGVRADNYCLSCGYRGDKTVFHRITESPEVLAEKLVYRYDGNGIWRSFLLYGYEFLTKEEALTATVDKLKEVYNGN